jgi:MraZ protein
MQPFTGIRDHRIDGKDRVVIPANQAEAIRTSSNGRLFLVPSADSPCLEAYPASVYESRAARQDPDRFEGNQQARRLFFHAAEEVELKGPGRITLPKRFAHLFPKGLVRVCGMNSYLELWDPETWEAEVGSALGPFASPPPESRDA